MEKKQLVGSSISVRRAVIVLKALGHAIRADCLLNLKTYAITPHSPTRVYIRSN